MDDRRGIIYFVAGSKHCVHAIVSVMSLRDHYKGPVALITEADGVGRRCCEQIAADDRLGPIKVIADATMKAGGHGVSYLCKTLLPRLSPFESTIFLDADTLVVGDFSELWPDVASGEVCLTRFSTWVSTGGKMRQRILGWEPFEPERVDRMFQKSWPAINTGVMSWGINSEAFAEDWHHTAAKRSVFMTDETAAQVIFPDHNVRVLDRRFNCSVVFDQDEDDARIYHGHGGKFWKRPSGWTVYSPWYEAALVNNVAGIRSARPPDKWFRSIPTDDQRRMSAYWQPTTATVK